MSATSTTQRDLSVQYQSFQLASHPSDLFLNGQVRWLQGTDGLTCPRDSRCLQLGISQAAYRLDLPLCNFRGEFIHWPACPHGQVWVGPCWLKPAGAYQAKFSFPGCHEVHLTLASKAWTLSQPVLFKCPTLMSKIQYRHTYDDKGAPQQQSTSAKHKKSIIWARQFICL